MFGIEQFTAIINPPEAAILAVAAAGKATGKPVGLGGSQGRVEATGHGLQICAREVLKRLLRERVDAFNQAASGTALTYPRYEGGFFVSVFTPDAEKTAERMRELGVFVVPLEGAVRVALCSTRAQDIPRLIAALEEGLSAAGGAE